MSLYHHLQSILERGESVAVATIVRARGSVPREVGAKMIIHPLGQHVGTVGGGCGEADVIRAGLDVIQDGIPRTVHVDLTEDISMQSLGVCGGVMDVFVERWVQEETQDENQDNSLGIQGVAQVECRAAFGPVYRDRSGLPPKIPKDHQDEEGG